MSQHRHLLLVGMGGRVEGHQRRLRGPRRVLQGDELGEGPVGIAFGKGIGTLRRRRPHHIGCPRDPGRTKVEVHQPLGHDGLV